MHLKGWAHGLPKPQPYNCLKVKTLSANSGEDEDDEEMDEEEEEESSLVDEEEDEVEAPKKKRPEHLKCLSWQLGDKRIVCVSTPFLFWGKKTNTKMKKKEGKEG